MVFVIGVLGLIFYVAALLATKLFGTSLDSNMIKWFGTISASAYTLFQIMTLESWSMGIVRPVMEVYPWSWIFFVIFILITSFAVLNLFIGIIVDAMQQQSAAEQSVHTKKSDSAQTETNDTRSELIALRQEIQELRKLLLR